MTPTVSQDHCECCGATTKLAHTITTVAPIVITLCEYCLSGNHIPKWLIDGVVDDNGGMEFCPEWLVTAIRRAKYCVVKSEGGE